MPTPGIFSHDGAADDVREDHDSGPQRKRQKLGPASHSHQHVTTHNNSNSDISSNSNKGSDDLPPLADKVNEADLHGPLSPPAVRLSPKRPPRTSTSSPSQVTTSKTPPSGRPFQSPQSLAQTPKSSKPPQFAASSRDKTPNTNRFVSPSAPSRPMAAHSLGSSLASSSPGTKDGASPQPDAQSKRIAQPKNGLAKPPRKPESLNPRHISSAPAPHSTRFQFVKLLHNQLVRLNGDVAAMSTKDPELKLYTKSDQELIWMALDLEEQIATEKGAIYRNIMGQTVLARKRMLAPEYIAQCKEQLAQISKPQLRGGDETPDRMPGQGRPNANKPVVIDTGLTPSQEIQVLEKLITPITNLEAHGYISTAPTEDEIAKTAEAVEWSKNWEQCDRCSARFQVFPDRNIETGELTSGGTCTHHPGRMYFPQRAPNDLTWANKKYRCCGQELNESPGCTSVDGHVWKTTDPKRMAKLWNWVNTPANDSLDVNKAVAFDCEMGYTTSGMELLRVTATSWPNGAELLDVLVQPFGAILDLNSRWSGVLAEDLLHGVPWTKDWVAPPQQPGERKILRKVDSPKAARDLLFSLISPETVLIGHGLENDLNAMRIIHPKIVDTILLYPHKRGLPVRTSLKVLMEIHLRREIQIDTGNGHDSAEDARAAGDLVRLQVQNRWKFMQIEGWQFSDGVLCMRKKGEEGIAEAARSALAALTKSRSAESVDAEEGGVKLTEEYLKAGRG